MKLLLSWVRDFVDITAPAREIADTMALRGFEVAAIEDLGGGDAVIDFEVTANRPDCLSVLGFAREIATLYDLPLQSPALANRHGGVTPPASPAAAPMVDVQLEDPERCPRYAAAMATVTPSATPAWMAARLQAAGVSVPEVVQALQVMQLSGC